MTNTNIGFIGWKYYNSIRKKAVEQEFSWSGLLVSLSIAFLIVFISAQALNLIYQSIIAAKNHERFLNQKIYRLESINYLNSPDKIPNFIYAAKNKNAV